MSSWDNQMELFGQVPLPLITVDEIFGRADDELLRVLGEDRRLERKASGFAARAIGDYASMWANTRGGGLIVLGQADGGAFTGCAKLDQKHINELEKAPHTYCPDASFEVKPVPVMINGKSDFVLLFRVRYHETRVVRTHEGKAWIRRGDEKHALSDDEIRELQNLKGERLHELEPCALAFPADFDLQAIREFAAQVRTRNHISSDIDDVAILVQRKLGRRKDDGAFAPNVACALLFATDPSEVVPGCRVRFLRFEGREERTNDRYNLVKDETVEGTIPQLIIRTSQVIANQIRDFSWIGADGKFVTAAEYPRFAWYEAIVNACAHRSYSLKTMSVFVRMFDDRLEITSPGGLPPMVTPENIYDTTCPVNPHLMESLRYLDYVKAANEGTKRIRTLMADNRLPAPEFKQVAQDFAQVRVTLRNDIDHRRQHIDADAARIIGEPIFKSLKPDEKRVINYLATRGTINITDAQKLLNRGWESARALLTRLEERGLVRHVTTKHKDPKAHFVLAADVPRDP